KLLPSHESSMSNRMKVCLTSELADAALGRMQPHLQRTKETLCPRDHKLAVAHELAVCERLQKGHNLRKEPAERFSRFCMQRNFGAAAKGETVKAVPFRLESPAGLLQSRQTRNPPECQRDCNYVSSP